MSLAAQARALVQAGDRGSLATLCDGFPFASLVLYAAGERGHPIFLLSGLDVHAQNLGRDPRASLLVTGAPSLDAPRVTLIGSARPVTQSMRESQAYLARHPEARAWSALGDFAFYRLEPERVYYVGGFGIAGWAPISEYHS